MTRDKGWRYYLTRPGLTLVLAGLITLGLVAQRMSHAQVAEIDPNHVSEKWGPLKEGDRVGLKEVGPLYELQIATLNQGAGYLVKSIQHRQGTTFLVLTPPEASLMAPGLVKEIWIPTTAVRSAVKR